MDLLVQVINRYQPAIISLTSFSHTVHILVINEKHPSVRLVLYYLALVIVTPACPGSSPGASIQMPEPPQLVPFLVEEQRLYSELLLGDGAPQTISKGAPLR